MHTGELSGKTATIRRWLRRIWITAGVALTAAMILGFQADGLPENLFHSDAKVRVAMESDGYRFEPVEKRSPAKLVFIAGGMVDPRAYAPLLRHVAERGFAATLVKLPWRMAATEGQIAEVFRRVVARSDGGKWVLAGHSRGGMLAARYMHRGVNLPSGLVLLATTHPRDFDLSALQLKVTKVYGTLDGVAPVAKIKENARLLPPATRCVAIEGGNHVQFGYYRYQFGDHAATISRQQQQEAVVEAVIDVLNFGTSAH